MRAAIHSGVLGTMAQVLEIDQEEFFDAIDENERNFEDLVKCKNPEDFKAIRAQRNKKVNGLRRALFILNDLAVKFIDSSCTLALFRGVNFNRDQRRRSRSNYG